MSQGARFANTFHNLTLTSVGEYAAMAPYGFPDRWLVNRKTSHSKCAATVTNCFVGFFGEIFKLKDWWPKHICLDDLGYLENKGYDLKGGDGLNN